MEKNKFSVKDLAIIGMMIALSIILDRFTIYITPTFKAISFAYLPGLLVASMFGPLTAILFGLIADNVKYFLNPQGPYIIWYAISEMFSYYVYAKAFYKKDLKLKNVIIARLIILVLVTFGMNYLWNYMIFGQAASKYYTGARVINNIVQFPFHVFIIYYVMKYLKAHKIL